jgi:glucokinase
MAVEHKYWLGFDLGGTKMAAQVFDAEFFQLGRVKEKTRGHEGAEAGMRRIIETIRKALETVNMEGGKLAGIGIGCPGPLDLNSGVVLEAPNLGWVKVPVRSILEKEFGCPAYVINDVDAGVYGEYRFGAGKGGRTVIGVFPGTGIGGGCVYEGKLLRGKSRSCMEVGHIQVLPSGPLCGCGRRGCLEAVASRLAVSAAAAQAAYRGEAPNLLKAVGTDLSNIRSGALASSIKAGDKVVEKILRTAASQIGKAIGNLVNILAPDRIVLGGGLVEAMPDLYIECVQQGIAKTVMSTLGDCFDVSVAKLGDDAAVMGAAAWAQSMVEN